MKSTNDMLSLVSTSCGVGIKQNLKHNRKVWIGGKLHISVVDGDIPVVAFYSGANVPDSSVALPLINETSKKSNVSSLIYLMLDMIVILLQSILKS